MKFEYFRKKIATALREKNNEPSPAAKYYSRANTLFADRMSRWEKKLSARQKKVRLFIFCGMITLLAGLRFYQAIYHPEKPGHTFLQHSIITAPKDVTLPDSLNIELLKQEKLLHNSPTIKHDSLNNQIK